VIHNLQAQIEAAKGDRLPPVEQWDPPYCGDIGMRIRADGTWIYQNSPIGRKALVRLFSRILRRDLDGRTYLITPVEKVDVIVEDAPFLAVEMHVEGTGPSQRLTFRTNVDDIVACGPEHPLRFATQPDGSGPKPYVLVRGRLEALMTRALYYDLMELAVPGEGNSSQVPGLWSAGTFFPLPLDG
jgi:uncharacterized protein